MGNFAACRNCGRCVLGCPHGVKWDARVFLNEAAVRGAEVVTGSVVERLVVRQGQAQGVVVRSGFRRRVYDADWIVLAAGGLGTPVILDNSGIAGEPRLFVDPVLCVAAPFPDAGQDAELPMPFIVERDGYIISPYFDQLSYFFNRRWKPPAGNILSLMIKLADANSGTVDRRGIHKVLTAGDRRRLSQAVDLCAEIFSWLGVRRDSLVLGTLNAGHPGGMFPLTPACSRSLRPTALPENVYIADASLFPAPLGKPPILTIMALANAVAKRILSVG
jgi:ferredoxin